MPHATTAALASRGNIGRWVQGATSAAVAGTAATKAKSTVVAKGATNLRGSRSDGERFHRKGGGCPGDNGATTAAATTDAKAATAPAVSDKSRGGNRNDIGGGPRDRGGGGDGSGSGRSIEGVRWCVDVNSGSGSGARYGGGDSSGGRGGCGSSEISSEGDDSGVAAAGGGGGRKNSVVASKLR